MAVEYKRMQSLRGTAAEWGAANIVLLSGEIGIETQGPTGPRLKIGNGTSTWSQLPFLTTEDVTARNGVASLQADVTALDGRMVAVEASVDVIPDLVDAIETKQPLLPLGTTAGDVLTWLGGSYGPQAPLMPWLVALTTGASIEAAFNAMEPVVYPGDVTVVTYDKASYMYIGAAGDPVTTSTAADFVMLGIHPDHALIVNFESRIAALEAAP